jgi:uncharacterized delta-60 repeat protein
VRKSSGGSVSTVFAGNINFADDVVVLSSGKILVAGEGATNNLGQHSQFCVARYNSNGTLDTTFGGGDGKVITNFGTDFCFEPSLKVLASGKFILAGTSYSAGTTLGDAAVARYNADGSLDTSFGSGTGKVRIDFGSTATAKANVGISGVAVDGSGRIYLGGHIVVGNTTSDFVVARLSSGGLLDPGFGSGKGFVKTDFTSASNPAAYDGANAIAVTSAGKILAVGSSNSNTSGKPGRFALVQYTSSGALDTSFGYGTGKVLTNINPDPLSSNRTADATNLSFNGQALALTSNGKFVVTGYGSGTTYDSEGFATAYNEGFGVARYNANGSLDSSFGVGGKKESLLIPSAYGVIVDPAGKIVVAGNNGTKSALVRLGTSTVTTASISGQFYNDKNGNGHRDAATEPLLSNWQAYVDSNNNGVYDYGEPTAWTDSSGNYTIKGLAAGTYRVREYRKTGWTRTQPAGTYPLGYYDVTLASGASATGKVFGNRFTG